MLSILSDETNNGYFSLLPIELYDIVFNNFDDMCTIARLLSTNKFIYQLKLKIKYKAYLYVNRFALKWRRDTICSAGKMQLEINDLEHYYRVCQFQHIIKTCKSPLIKILGLYTDLPLTILNSPDFTCDMQFEIIDHTTFRHIIFSNTNTHNFIRIKLKSDEFFIFTSSDSEIFNNRHPIYTNNELIADIDKYHTTTKKIFIEDTEYFISSYTEPLHYLNWRS